MSDISRRNFLGTAAGVVASTAAGPLFAMRIQTAPQVSASASQHDRLQPDWYRRKIAQVQSQMAERKLDAMVLMHAPNVIYTTGYFHRSTERPLAALIPKSGNPTLFIPGLEEDQVKEWWVKDFETYFDFPGPENRVRW